MRTAFFVCLALASFASACSSSVGPSVGPSVDSAGAISPTDPPVVVALEAEPSPSAPQKRVRVSQAALWKRLASDKLEGLAMVWSDAVLYPSAAAARRGTPKRRHTGKQARAVHILADEGDVLKVRTWLSPRVRRGMRALTPYDLTLYVEREQLIPVLVTAITKTFDDGSGYALREGMLLQVGDTIEPIEGLLRKAKTTIEAEHVGLAFVPQAKERAFEAPGEALGCGAPKYRGRFPREVGQTRVYGVKEERRRLAERERRKRAERRRKKGSGPDVFGHDFGRLGMGLGYEEVATCTLARGYEPENAGHGRESARLDGRHFMAARKAPPGDECGPGMRTFRHPSGRVLVDVSLKRATLRLSAPQSALRRAGGCGGVAISGWGSGRGFGSLAPAGATLPKVLAARGKTKVYFGGDSEDGSGGGSEGGSFAGYHMRGTTKFASRAANKPIRKRFCVEHANVSTNLCFRRADLVEVPAR